MALFWIEEQQQYNQMTKCPKNSHIYYYLVIVPEIYRIFSNKFKVLVQKKIISNKLQKSFTKWIDVYLEATEME